jgi:hypothetical protein
MRPTILDDLLRSCCYSNSLRRVIQFQRCVSRPRSFRLTGSLQKLYHHQPTHGQKTRGCCDRYRGSKNRRANPNYQPPLIWTRARRLLLLGV